MPAGVLAAAPGFNAYLARQAIPSAPYAGRPNYAHATQPFHWGWFGAERYAPVVHQHKGYYGSPITWSNYRWQ